MLSCFDCDGRHAKLGDCQSLLLGVDLDLRVLLRLLLGYLMVDAILNQVVLDALDELFLVAFFLECVAALPALILRVDLEQLEIARVTARLMRRNEDQTWVVVREERCERDRFVGPGRGFGG